MRGRTGLHADFLRAARTRDRLASAASASQSKRPPPPPPPLPLPLLPLPPPLLLLLLLLLPPPLLLLLLLLSPPLLLLLLLLLLLPPPLLLLLLPPPEDELDDGAALTVVLADALWLVATGSVPEKVAVAVAVTVPAVAEFTMMSTVDGEKSKGAKSQVTALAVKMQLPPCDGVAPVTALPVTGTLRCTSPGLGPAVVRVTW